MTRREVREQAFILIFESFFRNETPDEIIDVAVENEEFKISEDAVNMFRGTLEHTDEIDEKIRKFSEKRQIERIPKANIAIIRLAVYEILFGGTPVNVSISEAVLLAKKYTLDSDVSFINGLLGSFARNLENE